MTLRERRVVEAEVLRPIAGLGKLEDGLENAGSWARASTLAQMKAAGLLK